MIIPFIVGRTIVILCIAYTVSILNMNMPLNTCRCICRIYSIIPSHAQFYIFAIFSGIIKLIGRIIVAVSK